MGCAKKGKKPQNGWHADANAIPNAIEKWLARIVNILGNSGKTVYISGPLATLRRGSDVHHSRLLALDHWLQSLCHTHKLHYIHNFYLFWERPLFFTTDGLHPSKFGCHMLSDNIRRSTTQYKH